MRKINVQGVEIVVVSKEGNDYISLTDMLRAKDGDFFISDWLRNRNTIEFLGIWEQINNPDFNYGEFAIIRSKTGLNSYKISVKDWVEKTKAIGLRATAGRYGGTYAHKDIAFEFGIWISPEFKLYLIKEFERLKIKENERSALGWDAKRMLTKINYKIHTDSIKENIILPQRLTVQEATITYANEADVLNVALFGMTAQDWKIKNKIRKGNMRDYADVYQLVCLANLESLTTEHLREDDLKTAANLALRVASETDIDQNPPGSGAVLRRWQQQRRHRFETALERLRGGIVTSADTGLLPEDCVWAATWSDQTKDPDGWRARFEAAEQDLREAQLQPG